MKGYQVLIDFCDLPYSLCVNDGKIAKIFSQVAKAINADVISLIRYRFPETAEDGFTVVLTLDASHLSAHSYANDGLMAVDAFISGDIERSKKCAVQIISQLGLEAHICNKQIIKRFVSCVSSNKTSYLNHTVYS